MKHLIKYLKPFLLSILLIIGLLYLQAQSDLALPEYMSQIVDKGIANYGIENASPEAVSQSTYDNLMLFTTDEDKSFIEKYYTFISFENVSDAEKYIAQYPLLKTQSIYVRTNINDSDLATLNQIMSRPLLIKAGIDQLISDPAAAKNSPFMANLPAGADPYEIINQLPQSQLNGLRTQMLARFETMPASTIETAARATVKSEYELIGIDMSSYQQRYILTIGGYMLLIAMIGSAASISVGFLSARIAARLAANLRKDVFQKVISFSSAEFNQFSTASLITRTTNDIQQIQQITVMILRMVFYAPIIGVGAFLKILQTNSSMSWIIGVAVGLILIIIAITFVIGFPKFKLIQTLVDKLNLVMRESLSGMLVVRAFNTQKQQEEKFERVNQDVTKTNLFVNRLMSILMPTMMFTMNGVGLLIVWIGSQQIDIGTLQVGEMMAFLQYSMQIIMSFLMISMISIMLPRAQVSAVRISEVLQTPLSIHDPLVGEVRASNHASVEFKHVSFRYPGAEEDVLRDISFQAAPGQVTAFIGSTGSGKSTIINLIPRFFDVTEGQILINGVDIREIKQHDLRAKIGYVPQKGVLFSGTIDSNLRYGKQDASIDELKQAADIAQASDFIEAKELGFSEPIAQGGTNVSGGQKQRLSIARALVKKANIYIFDDTFSALDYKTESLLRLQLDELIKQTKTTVFIVAQRINTIMKADQIVVLDQGKIAGLGTHEELLETCKVYQEIAYSQLSKEELAHE